MQEDRNIQHSLHINNVQELIEKEKVADPPLTDLFHQEMQTILYSDPGKTWEVANDKNGTSPRNDLDRVSSPGGHVRQVLNILMQPLIMIYKVHLPGLPGGWVWLCDHWGDWSKWRGQAHEGGQDLQVIFRAV